MVKKILDIGAGTLRFAENLVSLNKDKDLLVFCGEPDWKDHYYLPQFIKVVSREKAFELCERNKPGIHRINSEYSAFAFDDSSLDMVTLNSPHPMMSPIGIGKELERCITPNGIFFYGHSTHIEVRLPSCFELLIESSYPSSDTLRNWWTNHSVDISKKTELSKELPSIIPASPCILSNIPEFRLKTGNPQYRNRKGNSYIYNSIRLFPNYKVWIRK